VRLLAAACSGLAVALAIGLWTRVVGVGGRVRRDRWAAQRRWLVQAGAQLTPAQFWTGSVAIGAAVFLAVVLLTRAPAVAVVPALSSTALPRFWYARRRVQRLRAVQEAWPDGLRELVAGIAAGMSLPQAICGLAASGPPPLQEAFARFPTLMRLTGVVPALEVVREELADPTSDRVLEVLVMAHQRGGRLVSELLADLAAATTEDVRTLDEIATSALEQKINARAVFVLPWLVLLALTAQPGHFRDFYRSPGGLLVVALAGIASALGMVLLGHLGKEPVEQRVLGTGLPEVEG
jgi:tight adherence protein B